MNPSDLSTLTPDWNLPLKHEAIYSAQFMKGGRTFLDIGAHVGTWTLRLAPLFERVFCFEPDARACAALRANIETAGLTNVEVVQLAVTDRVGTAVINLYPNPSGNSLLTPEQSNRKPDTDPMLRPEEVATTTIDAFCKERSITDVDLIKMDIEGAEITAVPGAVETFRVQRPDFFLELHGLFHERLRRVLSFEECDVIDGGRAGLSLVRHRAEWPAFTAPDFRVYPHGVVPTLEDLEDLRREHGIIWEAPRTGFLSVEGL